MPYWCVWNSRSLSFYLQLWDWKCMLDAKSTSCSKMLCEHIQLFLFYFCATSEHMCIKNWFTLNKLQQNNLQGKNIAQHGGCPLILKERNHKGSLALVAFWEIPFSSLEPNSAWSHQSHHEQTSQKPSWIQHVMNYNWEVCLLYCEAILKFELTESTKSALTPREHFNIN